MIPSVLEASCVRILRILFYVSDEPTQEQEALESSGEDCEICGSEMYGLHCKLVCPNCGYRRDCSDP